jgi:hypothetical protein
VIGRLSLHVALAKFASRKLAVAPIATKWRTRGNLSPNADQALNPRTFDLKHGASVNGHRCRRKSFLDESKECASYV